MAVGEHGPVESLGHRLHQGECRLLVELLLGDLGWEDRIKGKAFSFAFVIGIWIINRDLGSLLVDVEDKRTPVFLLFGVQRSDPDDDLDTLGLFTTFFWHF